MSISDILLKWGLETISTKLLNKSPSSTMDKLHSLHKNLGALRGLLVIFANLIISEFSGYDEILTDPALIGDNEPDDSYLEDLTLCFDGSEQLPIFLKKSRKILKKQTTQIKADLAELAFTFEREGFADLAPKAFMSSEFVIKHFISAENTLKRFYYHMRSKNAKYACQAVIELMQLTESLEPTQNSLSECIDDILEVSNIIQD